MGSARAWHAGCELCVGDVVICGCYGSGYCVSDVLLTPLLVILDVCIIKVGKLM